MNKRVAIGACLLVALALASNGRASPLLEKISQGCSSELAGKFQELVIPVELSGEQVSYEPCEQITAEVGKIFEQAGLKCTTSHLKHENLAPLPNYPKLNEVLSKCDALISNEPV